MTVATRLPAWLAGLFPLVLLAAGIAIFVALGAPGLERSGVPVEEVAVDRTVLRPGEIEVHVRNDGPDPVAIEQVFVNDAFVAFEQTDPELGRLEAGTVTATYPWLEGEAYEVVLLTATGGTIPASIEVATLTPETDLSFFGLMALIGIYVGVIPVTIGMLWLPWIRRINPRWIGFLMALTLGLLGFLGVDAVFEGIEFAGLGSQAFGGPLLVLVGAAVAYLALAAVDGLLSRRRRGGATSGLQLATLIAVGIGLHNLGEGLAIGSAYAIGSLALGATLIVGFALHNTTEGLAIVAPIAEGPPADRRLAKLVGLGLLAGAPAILGAFIGASAFDPSLAAFMFGLGAGAIAQVIVQIAPTVRDGAGRLLHPLAVAGLLSGIAIMYLTGLLVSAMTISDAVQDYAKAIYSLSGRLDGPVSTSALAERLSVSPASASAMVRRLAEQGLAEHERYGGVELTEEGEAVALEVLRGHRLTRAVPRRVPRRSLGPCPRGGRAARARAVGLPRRADLGEARRSDPRPARRPDPGRRPDDRGGADRQPRRRGTGGHGALRARLRFRPGDAALPRAAGDRNRRGLRGARSPAVRRPDNGPFRPRRARPRRRAGPRNASGAERTSERREASLTAGGARDACVSTRAGEQHRQVTLIAVRRWRARPRT